MEQKEFGEILLNIFISFTVISVFFIIYCQYNPYSFVDLEEKLIWANITLGILVGIFHADEIEKNINKIFSKYKKSKIFNKFKFLDMHIFPKINLPRIKKPKFRRKLNPIKLVNLIFQVLLILFLLLVLAREFKEDFLGMININYFMITVIVFGAISILFEDKSEKYDYQKNIKQKITKKDYALIFILGVVGSVIIYYKTKDIGYLSYAISILSGILIIMLSILILEDDET